MKPLFQADSSKVAMANRWLFLLGLILCGCSSTQDTCLNRSGEPPTGNLGRQVNSPGNDFSPLLSQKGELLFTSDRSGLSEDFPEDYDRPGEDLYRAVVANGVWGRGRLLSFPTTTPKNEGTPTLSADGSYAVIARAHDRSLRGLGGSDLYRAIFKDSVFTQLENLGPNVNSRYWDAQPSLLSDTMLVFASDRPNNHGRTDLWRCSRTIDGWSEAINMGDDINTSGREQSPFLTRYGDYYLLIYASSGHPDKGNDTDTTLDLYYSLSKDAHNWDPVKPLDGLRHDFKSPNDDAFPFLTQTKDTVYFASNREGGCGGYDLYSSPIGSMWRVIAVDDGNRVVDNAHIWVFDQERHLHDGLGTFESLSQPPGVYEVSTSAPQHDSLPPVRIILEPFKDRNDTLHLGRVRPALMVELRTATVPLFITGYYRLNTPENLDDLEKRRALFELHTPVRWKQIDTSRAKGWADSVRALLKDSIFTPLVSIARVKPFGDDECLEISIAGFADPDTIATIREIRRNDTVIIVRGYRPEYVEAPLQFRDSTDRAVFIPRGKEINNRLLSWLRARYSGFYIDSVLSREAWYCKLKTSDRVRFRFTGAGVDNSQVSMEANRRVTVAIRRVPRCSR